MPGPGTCTFESSASDSPRPGRPNSGAVGKSVVSEVPELTLAVRTPKRPSRFSPAVPAAYP
jgi:hypothetical protein